MARRSSKARRHPKAKPQGILELNAQGFGFVKTAEGEFFIPASKVNGAFPGDLVEISRLSGQSPDRHYSEASRKPSARVARVIMRARDTLIGRYEVAEPFGVVVPEDPSVPCDIFTLRSDAPHVNDGDLVEVRIIEFPTRNSAATGTVVRVFGSESDTDIAIDLIIADHRFETEFSPAALEEAEHCSLDASLATVQGYRDLRDEFIFTIDPVDARDFDDAISLERKDGNFVLGVHIADVSRFVAYDSSLDMDARRRATSVYLVDRVLPMLPEKLSNGLCSLMPEEDRCTISVKVELSPGGSVLSYEVFPSVIRSKARLSYDQAQAILEASNRSRSVGQCMQALAECEVPYGAKALSDETVHALIDRVPKLDTLAKALFSRRKKDGCMDFDRVEAKAKLDGEGRPLEITYRRRTAATELIEEAMILANSLVAQWLTEIGLPCVYRVHDAPDGDALRALYEVLQESSLFSDVNKRLFCDGNPHALQDVLARVQGTPQQELVNELLLRAMKRAVYRTELSDHYGLALQTYCHFTSPIRRYPDLLVHRMLKEAFFGHSAPMRRSVIRLHGWLSIRLIWSAKRKKPLGSLSSLRSLSILSGLQDKLLLVLFLRFPPLALWFVWNARQRALLLSRILVKSIFRMILKSKCSTVRQRVFVIVLDKQFRLFWFLRSLVNADCVSSLPLRMSNACTMTASQLISWCGV